MIWHSRVPGCLCCPLKACCLAGDVTKEMVVLLNEAAVEKVADRNYSLSQEWAAHRFASSSGEGAKVRLLFSDQHKGSDLACGQAMRWWCFDTMQLPVHASVIGAL